MEVRPSLRIQGVELSGEQLGWLQSWIDAHPEWSRFRLRRELCLQWNWCNAAGHLKTFAARSLFSKLELQGRLRLPPLRAHMRRVRPWSRQSRAMDQVLEQAPGIVDALSALQPVELHVLAAGSPAERRAEAQLARFHYRGFDRPVGAHLYYLGVDRAGRELAVMLLGAAAWRCAARDRWLGWDDTQRQSRLSQLANHARFLVLPGVQVPHLASHLLGLLTRRVVRDWRTRHAQQLVALETFVESGRFAGTCYKAANWQWVGQTRGRSRQDTQHRLQVGVKEVYLYGLQRELARRRGPRPVAPDESSPTLRAAKTSVGLES
jgi:hypothetical protein